MVMQSPLSLEKIAFPVIVTVNLRHLDAANVSRCKKKNLKLKTIR